MSKQSETGIKRIISAFFYSKNGILSCWKMEAAFRQEIVACIFLVPLAIFIGNGGVEKAILISTCLLVLIVEILNSAIEAVVDRISPTHHDLSGLAKDLGSAAVLLSIVNLLVVWSFILLI
jgi:diacylglycerol kinase (ATP)